MLRQGATKGSGLGLGRGEPAAESVFIFPRSPDLPDATDPYFGRLCRTARKEFPVWPLKTRVR
jgi:hypothetical protein